MTIVEIGRIIKKLYCSVYYNVYSWLCLYQLPLYTFIVIFVFPFFQYLIDVYTTT